MSICIAHYAKTPLMHLIAKLSGITEWYKNGTNLYHMQPVYGSKTVCETNRCKWYYGRVLCAVGFNLRVKAGCETLQIALHIALKLAILG